MLDYDKLPVLWVNTQDALYSLIDEIDSSDVVALDTEFIRRNTYFPILALLQINTGKAIYLIDVPCLDLHDLWQALAEVPALILYACGEDLGIFYLLADCPPLTNVIDLQMGVAYLTADLQIGYSRAVEKFLGLVLDKSESQSDWLARPLSEKQLNYAADDVRYLLALFDVIKAELMAKKLFGYVIEDCQSYANELYDAHHLPDEAVYLNYIAPNYNHEQIAVLQVLCEWREKLGRQKNCPPTFIIGKQPLREIILALPNSFSELAKTTLNRKSLHRYGSDILALIKQARAMPKEKRPPLPNPTYISKDKPFKNELKSLIDTYSQDTGVPITLLLRNRWMDELMWSAVSETPLSTKALQGYRKQWLEDSILPLFVRHKQDILQAMALAKKVQTKS